MCEEDRVVGEKDPKIWLWFLLLSIGVIGIMIAGYFIIQCQCGKPDGPGAFGDMFGVINALFSGLAFGGLIIALFFQRKELKIQHKELELTRSEMELTRGEVKGQKEVMTQQLSALKQQQFESTFFQMLTLLKEITDNITSYTSATRMGGTFMEILNSVGSKFHGMKSLGPAYHSKKEAIKVYDEFYNNNPSLLGPYFRTLYYIVKYVDESDFSNKDKYKYVRLVRAQLVSGNLGLLLLNCHTQKGEKFKPFIEKYALLKHTPDHFNYFDEGIVTDLKAGFEPSAFDSDLVDK